jgi:hypothetical protein
MVRERLRIETPIVSLFRHPTIGALAAFLEAKSNGAPAPAGAAPPVTDRATKQRAAAARMKAVMEKVR